MPLVRPHRLPISVRIGLSSALLSAGVVLTFTIASSWMVFENMIEEADFFLRDYSETLLDRFREEPDFLQNPEQANVQATLSAEPATVLVLAYLSPDHEWRSDQLMAQADTIDYLQGKPRKKGRTIWTEDETWRLYSRSRSNGRESVVLAMNLQEIRKEVWRMAKRYLVATPLAAVFIGFGSWLIGKRSVKPLKRLALGMNRIAEGELSERVHLPHAGDDLDKLADVFNRMASQLQRSFEQASRFTSDASHELRTPITVLRGQIEQLLQEADELDGPRLADALDQVERLRSIIDGLLLLSRSDAGKLQKDAHAINLSRMVHEVAQDFEGPVEDSEMTYEENLQPDVYITGDVRLIRQAIYNLISNALKYNQPEKGTLIIRLRSEKDVVRLSFFNSGPVIPEEERAKIFRRFYRGQPDRESPAAPGTGLGLSIVEAAMEAHDGKIRYDVDSGMNRFTMEFREPEEEE